MQEAAGIFMTSFTRFSKSLNSIPKKHFNRIHSLWLAIPELETSVVTLIEEELAKTQNWPTDSGCWKVRHLGSKTLRCAPGIVKELKAFANALGVACNWTVDEAAHFRGGGDVNVVVWDEGNWDDVKNLVAGSYVVYPSHFHEVRSICNRSSSSE